MFAAALLLIAQISGGQIQPRSAPPPEPVLTAADFESGRIDRGSGLVPVEWRVQIHPSLPPYRIRLIPDLTSRNTWAKLHRVGSIEVSREGNGAILQTIAVAALPDVSLFVKNVRIEDVNFDGYLDIGTLYDSGAKWGCHRYLLFDPASGRFVQTDLTQDLLSVRGNGLFLDRASKTISTGFLINADAEGMTSKSWRIVDGRLVPIAVTERVRDAAGSLVELTRTLPGR